MIIKWNGTITFLEVYKQIQRLRNSNFEKIINYSISIEFIVNNYASKFYLFIII